MATFVGCDVTDEELAKGENKAINRVKKRKSQYKKAEVLGVTTTAEVTRAENDALAVKKGFADRKAALAAQKDALAVQKGFADRKEAQKAQRDALAVRQLGPGATWNDLRKVQKAAKAAAAEAENQ
ncbi:hypothetical protein [Pseudomonas sp. GL-B-16]|uniref:hypothetical protein n=1 Tax=Pseudomonas sp. GL-B-16 TaxID=2832373 RepID=UPI001CBDDA80|nr:hypothetical protein [Pseudomonas sp. GL-B-16]